MSQSRDQVQQYKRQEIESLKNLSSEYSKKHSQLSENSKNISEEKEKIAYQRQLLESMKEDAQRYREEMIIEYNRLDKIKEEFKKISVNLDNEIKESQSKISDVLEEIEKTFQMMNLAIAALDQNERECENVISQIEMMQKIYAGAKGIISNAISVLDQEGNDQEKNAEAREDVQKIKREIDITKNNLFYKEDDQLKAKQESGKAIESAKNSLGRSGAAMQQTQHSIDLVKKKKELFLLMHRLNHYRKLDQGFILEKIDDLNDLLKNGPDTLLDSKAELSGQVISVREAIEKTIQSVAHQEQKRSSIQPKDRAEMKAQLDDLTNTQAEVKFEKSEENKKKNMPVLEAFIKVLENDMNRIRKGNALYKNKKIHNLENLIKEVKNLGSEENLNLKEKIAEWKQDPDSAYSHVIKRSHTIHKLFHLKNHSEINIDKFFENEYPNIIDNLSEGKSFSPKI